MWSADKGGHHEIALNLLKRMENENIKRNEETYAACVWACEKGGEGEIALHVIDLMKQEGIPMDTQIYKAVMWACIKGGLWQTSLELYKEMIKNKIYVDDSIYNSVIWAYEQGNQWEKSLEILRIMKFEKIQLNTMAFDGVISACYKAGEWQQCLDLFAWMDREMPIVEKSYVTYKLLIEALDAAQQEKKIMEIYTLAMRQGFFIPWIGNTRQIDLRGMSLSIAKVALNNVLLSMRKGTLPVFTLSCIYADKIDGNIKSSFKIEELEEYLDSLEPAGVLTPLSREFDPETNTEKIVIYRDAASVWSYKNV
jgi:pentatricopeptide repeat protein